MSGFERANEAAQKIRLFQSQLHLSNPRKRQLEIQHEGNRSCKRLKQVTSSTEQDSTPTQALIGSSVNEGPDLPNFAKLLHENSCAEWTGKQVNSPTDAAPDKVLVHALNSAGLTRHTGHGKRPQDLQDPIPQENPTAQSQQINRTLPLDNSAVKAGYTYLSSATLHTKDMMTLPPERNSTTQEIPSLDNASRLDSSCPAADFPHCGDISPLQISDFSHFGGLSAEVIMPDNFSGFGDLMFSSNDWVEQTWPSIDASIR